MKALTHKLLDALCNAADANDGHITLENPPYMPLSFEKIGSECFAGTYYPTYSICHYRKQNGDMMRDPDVTFLRFDGSAGTKTRYAAISYRNDFCHTDQRSLLDDGSGYYPQLQASQTVFLRRWVANLRIQGFEDCLRALSTSEAAVETSSSS